MIPRSALAALATLLLSSVTCAAPLLRADVVVSGPIVTVGDMFEDAGDLAGTPMFRAPNPGTSGTVALTDITAAANRAGLAVFDVDGLAAVRVSRAGVVVDDATIRDLIVADLTSRGILEEGMSAELQLDAPVPTMNAEAVEQAVKVVSLRYLPTTGTFAARFVVAGIADPLEVSGSIELQIEVPHLVANLAAGTVLTADDVEMRPVALRFAESAGVVTMDQVLGKALTRQSRQGLMLKANDVTTPLLISKNELVTIYYRQGPMTLTVKGQAVTGAEAGAPLQVLNLMSRRVISATALASGAVEVSAAPVTLAGL